MSLEPGLQLTQSVGPNYSARIQKLIKTAGEIIAAAIRDLERQKYNLLFTALHNSCLDRYQILLLNSAASAHNDESAGYGLGSRILADFAKAAILPQGALKGKPPYLVENVPQKTFLFQEKTKKDAVIPDSTTLVYHRAPLLNPLTAKPPIHGFTTEDKKLPYKLCFPAGPLHPHEQDRSDDSSVMTSSISWDDYDQSVPRIISDINYRLKQVNKQAARVFRDNPLLQISQHIVRHGLFFTHVQYHHPRRKDVRQNNEITPPRRSYAHNDADSYLEINGVKRNIVTLVHPIFFDLQKDTFRFNPRFLSALHACSTALRDLKISHKGTIFDRVEKCEAGEVEMRAVQELLDTWDEHNKAKSKEESAAVNNSPATVDQDQSPYVDELTGWTYEPFSMTLRPPRKRKRLNPGSSDEEGSFEGGSEGSSEESVEGNSEESPEGSSE